MIQEANLHWRYLDTDSNLVMPWYTLPTLQWLVTQELKKWRVFEYGAGYSTIWWKLHCAEIVSVESNEQWANAMDAYFRPKSKDYITFLDSFSQFDCIVVDGIEREECVKFCLPFLKSGGVLIIDNYNSEDYHISKTQEELKDMACTIHKQPNHSTWETAVFIKP